MTWRSCCRTYTAWPSVTRRVTAFQTDVPGKGIGEIICNKSCQVQEPSVLGLLQDSEFTKEPSPIIHYLQNVFVRSSLKSLRETQAAEPSPNWLCQGSRSLLVKYNHPCTEGCWVGPRVSFIQLFFRQQVPTVRELVCIAGAGGIILILRAGLTGCVEELHEFSETMGNLAKEEGWARGSSLLTVNLAPTYYTEQDQGLCLL